MNLTLNQLLTEVVGLDGSDLVLHADNHPFFRVHGDLITAKHHPVLSGDDVRELCYSILSPAQIQTFEEHWELDLGYRIADVSRFRVNYFIQRGTMGGCFRPIPFKIPTTGELSIPPAGIYMAERPRGMVLVTGPTGSGKTTTLAALVNHINSRVPCHIVTIEDPIEYVQEDKKAIINQRELGTDTHSFEAALKHVLRQDPDVILVGEMRDLETMRLAITAAETGHLVFATLHTTNAVQTVDRVIDVFPTFQQNQVRMQLAVNLVGVVSQTLLKRAEGIGRLAAWEIMVCSHSIRNLIREAKTHQIFGVIQTGVRQGMMTLDQCLAGYVKSGVVTYDAALEKCSNPVEFNNLLATEEPATGKAKQPAAAAGQR